MLVCGNALAPQVPRQGFRHHTSKHAYRVFFNGPLRVLSAKSEAEARFGETKGNTPQGTRAIEILHSDINECDDSHKVLQMQATK